MVDKLTNQQVFDQVVINLSKMLVQSLNDEGKCAYRGANDLKCAIGGLLTDDEVNFPEGIQDEKETVYKLDDLMSSSVSYLKIANLLPQRFSKVDISLLTSFQGAHDDLENWNVVGCKTLKMKSRLMEIANRYSLDTQVVNEHFNF